MGTVEGGTKTYRGPSYKFVPLWSSEAYRLGIDTVDRGAVVGDQACIDSSSILYLDVVTGDAILLPIVQLVIMGF